MANIRSMSTSQLKALENKLKKQILNGYDVSRDLEKKILSLTIQLQQNERWLAHDEKLLNSVTNELAKRR